METPGDSSGSQRNDHDYFGHTDTTERSKEVKPAKSPDNAALSDGIAESTMEANKEAASGLNEFDEVEEEIVESSFTDDDDMNDEALYSEDGIIESTGDKTPSDTASCDKETSCDKSVDPLTVTHKSVVCSPKMSVGTVSEDNIGSSVERRDSSASRASPTKEHSDVSSSTSSGPSCSTSNSARSSTPSVASSSTLCNANRSSAISATKSTGNTNQANEIIVAQTEAKKGSNAAAAADIVTADIDLASLQHGDSEENEASVKTCDSSAVSVASVDDLNDFTNDPGDEVDMSDVSSSFAESESIGDAAAGRGKSSPVVKKPPRRRQMGIMIGYKPKKRRKTHSKKGEDDAESALKMHIGSENGIDVVFNSEAEGSVCDDRSETSSHHALEASSSEENLFESAHHPQPRPKRRCSSVGGEVADKYCWICHKDSGMMYKCVACPRVHHVKCHMQSSNVDPSDDPTNFQCPECVAVLKADNVNTRSPTLATVNLDQLCISLKHVIDLLKSQKDAHYFTSPVDTKEFPHYREYVVHPMDIQILERNVRNKEYGCTEAFLADVKWIVHNSIVFNSKAAKITNVAKNLLKICKREILEIETCAECYYNSIVRIDTWFIEVCKKPHLLVWARLKGYPPWPAKALKCKDGMVDCRFFGAHDKAWVPLKDCFLYSKLTPQTVKVKKGSHLEGGILELEKHIKKLRDKFGIFVYPPARMPYRPSQELEQLRLMLPKYNPNSSHRLSTKYLIHPDRIQMTAKRKVFDDEDEKPDPKDGGSSSNAEKPTNADSENVCTESSDKAANATPDELANATPDDLANASLDESANSEDFSSDEYTASVTSTDAETTTELPAADTEKTETPTSTEAAETASASTTILAAVKKDSVDSSAPSPAVASPTPVKAEVAIAAEPAARKLVTVKNIEKINATVTAIKSPQPNSANAAGTADVPESTSNSAAPAAVPLSPPRKASPPQSSGSNVQPRLNVGPALKRVFADSVDTIAAADKAKGVVPKKLPRLDVLSSPDQDSGDLLQLKNEDDQKKPKKPQVYTIDSSPDASRRDEDKVKEHQPTPKKPPLRLQDIVPGLQPKVDPSFDLNKVKDEPMDTEDGPPAAKSAELKLEAMVVDRRPSSSPIVAAQVAVTAAADAKKSRPSCDSTSSRCVNITETVTLSVVNRPAPAAASSPTPMDGKARGMTVVKSLLSKQPPSTVRPMTRDALEEANVIKKKAIVWSMGPPTQVVGGTDEAEAKAKKKPAMFGWGPHAPPMNMMSGAEESTTEMTPATPVSVPKAKKKMTSIGWGPPPMHSIATTTATAKANVKILPRPAVTTTAVVAAAAAAVNGPAAGKAPIIVYGAAPAKSSPKSVESAAVITSVYTNGSAAKAPTVTGLMAYNGPAPAKFERTPNAAAVTSATVDHQSANARPVKPAESTPSVAAGVLDECLMTEYQSHFRKFFEDTMDKLSGKGDLRARVLTLQKEIDSLKRNHEYVIDELKRDYEMQIAELRATSIAKTQFDLAAERLKFEQEKDRAVKEAKSKQWCSNCQRSANYYCCWNTAYCDFECQKDHWIHHVHLCKNDVKKKAAESSENEPPRIMMQNEVSSSYVLNGFEKPGSTYAYPNAGTNAASRTISRINKNLNTTRAIAPKPLLPRINSTSSPSPTSSIVSTASSTVANKGLIRPTSTVAYTIRPSSQFDK